MAEVVPASPSGSAGGRSLHSGIIQWLVDNFCVCEGCSVPRCLMYEMYVETYGQDAQNQVNPAMFGKCDSRSPIKTDPAGPPLSEFRRCPFWEQELAKKYSCTTLAFLADKYCGYCQDVLQNVRNQDLEKVEDSLTSFWKSLQQDTVMLLSLPDVCLLFKCYDVQLYKGIEDVLLRDFLEDVSLQYLKSVRLFSKKFKLWLLTALEGFPALLQISKLKDVTVFVKRLGRKIYLSNMAKTMRIVLKSSWRASTLKSDLHAIICQGTWDVLETAPQGSWSSVDDPEENTEMKCLSSLISLLGTSTDLSVFLNCLSANLQARVFQPSRSREEFMRLAATFQLRWNFLLTAVSKAMTLCHRDSFGSWHLFHLLLLEYMIHIIQSCLEKEEEDKDMGNLKDMLPDDQPPVPPDQEPFHRPDGSPAQEPEVLGADLPRVTLRHRSQDGCDPAGNSVVVRVPGFLVDTTTSNKLIQILLEDKATESTIKLSLPLGQETLITLNDGQKFVIHISDVS
ncbi:DNA-binding protein RFX8 isoform X6 [Camelus bactrianus]|uniref:DNA-binding protein RFX8 isoform X6 n=1 Tax=Camelus bactrianus TaxID=9837 RepID=A0A9W3GV90_CAMBA